MTLRRKLLEATSPSVTPASSESSTHRIGTRAVALLPTNEPPAIEYYEVHCEIEDGRWFADGSNANGPNGEWPWSA
jgi:hypothetical protein